MFGINYYKADPSTYVIKTVRGEHTARGRGLSFLYNAINTSIAAIPVNAQESPFIFGLQTADFQEVRLQGQVIFRIAEAEKTAELLNFVLRRDGTGYVSEDPTKLGDRVLQSIQSIVQERVQQLSLRHVLGIQSELAEEVSRSLKHDDSLEAMGIVILRCTVSAITPTPETKQALEAEAREALLQEADDAIYLRRKSSVEQERTIQEAELQTRHEIQQKEQEIEESRLRNERSLLRGQAETEQERIQAEIENETTRQRLVELSAGNSREQADAEAYGVASKMRAFSELPVDNLRAMALAQMEPEQLMALALESLAENAGKIGELNIAPDLFGQLFRKGRRSERA